MSVLLQWQMFHSPAMSTEALVYDSSSLTWYKSSHGGSFHNSNMLPLCLELKETMTVVDSQTQVIASTLLMADLNLTLA